MKRAVIVTDLGYGDAGKGSIVDYLARKAAANDESCAVIRYNGGPQAGHNVVTPDGRHHTFSQFGSGSFVPEVTTYLASSMLVNPLNMMKEAEHLISLGIQDIWDRTFIHEDCIVIMPWQVEANRLRESTRGVDRHGSCGEGIGQAVDDSITNPASVIRVKDLISNNMQDLYQKLFNSQIAILDRIYRKENLSVPVLVSYELMALVAEYKKWVSWVNTSSRNNITEEDLLIFEGAQGVLLDEKYGFSPYNTWSDTTPANALAMLKSINYQHPITKLGVIRSYMTRHGPGPFPTEYDNPKLLEAETHNTTGPWQGQFRTGILDLVAIKYAINGCNGIDELAVTCLDRHSLYPVCKEYSTNQIPGSNLTEWMFNVKPRWHTFSNPIPEIAEFLQTPITITSHGPTADDKKEI